MSELWDIQVLLYVGLSAGVVILMLIVLAIISRQVRVLGAEVESIRRDLRILDEGVSTVSQSLQARTAPAAPQPIEVAETPEPPEPT